MKKILLTIPVGNINEKSLNSVSNCLVDTLGNLGYSATHYKLSESFSNDKIEHFLCQNQEDDLFDEIYSTFANKQDSDVLVLSGFDNNSIHPQLSKLNRRIASELSTQIVLVVDNEQKKFLPLYSYDYCGVDILGFVSIDGSSNDEHNLSCLGVASTLNEQIIADKMNLNTGNKLSPAAFRNNMMEQARRANKRIVLPEGAEPRTVQAAIICQNKGIARCVLLADKKEVQQVAEQMNLTLPESLEIINPAEIAQNYVAPLVEMRKAKGMTEEKAREALTDSVFVGTMMMALDEVDGLVSGAVHTTANTIRPALQVIKTAPDASLVSSVFFMLMPDQVLVYGDCAVNPKPTAAELADIAIQSADSAKAFGIEPRVAMISYSTGNSGTGEDVEKVIEATKLAREKRPDLLIDGPLQYDAASVPSVGKQKAPDSKVAGQATVFIFPDLNTGNCTYKAVQRSANVLSVGPMLQGLNKPVNDLSRGALVGDIVYTIALTAIQAEQFKNRKA